MSVSWMVYATCVSSLLALAANVLERPLRGRERNTRLIWAAMLAGALVWPAVIMVFGRSDDGAAALQENVAARFSPAANPAARATAEPALIPPLTMPVILPTSQRASSAARAVAMITPLLVLSVLLLELIRIARARRRWEPGLIDDIPVLLSADFGPAIIGIVHPQIVLPAWALGLPPDQLHVMLAHESEHLATHDSRWLSVAFLAAVIAPWNLGVWWLLRRLRLAIEVDCDARVLRRGHDVEQYGNLLLEIARHWTGGSLLAAGFAERRSMLRVRIKSMTVGAEMTWSRQAWHVAVGMTMLLGACVLGPSRQQRRHSAVTEGTHDAAAHSIALDTSVVLPHIRAALDQFAPPTSGLPSVSTRFLRDTIRVGEHVELLTVTWFPKALLDSLRRAPLIQWARLAELSTASILQAPAVARTRYVGGRLYLMNALWQTMSPTSAGRIEVPPAVLTFQVLGWTPFPREEQRTEQSSAAVLVVRPQN